MTNNDILRRLRYALNYTDAQMMERFILGGLEVNRERLSNWLKKDDDPDFASLHDEPMAHFLNGLIIANRGKKENETPVAEKKLNNNIILRKLKIAFELRDEDILNLLDLADFKFSKHELSALFRKPDQDQYRVCKDQVLRNFLQGLQNKNRPQSEPKTTK